MSSSSAEVGPRSRPVAPPKEPDSSVSPPRKRAGVSNSPEASPSAQHHDTFVFEREEYYDPEAVRKLAECNILDEVVAEMRKEKAEACGGPSLLQENNSSTSAEFYKTAQERIRKLLAQLNQKGKTRIRYFRTGKGARVYPVGQVAYQNLPGWVKAFFAGGRYRDLDLVNAFPRLLWAILVRHGKTGGLEILEQYIKHREKIFDAVAEQLGLTGKIPRSDLKRLFLIALHGGNPYIHFTDGVLASGGVRSAMLDAFCTVVKEDLIIAFRTIPEYNALWMEIQQEPGKPNTKGTFISLIAQEEEFKVVQLLAKYLEKNTEWTAEPYMFDGLQAGVPADHPAGEEFPKQVLRNFERYLVEDKGYPTITADGEDHCPLIRVEEKPMVIPPKLIEMLQESTTSNVFSWEPGDPTFNDIARLIEPTVYKSEKEMEKYVRRIFISTIRHISLAGTKPYWCVKSVSPGKVESKKDLGKLRIRYLEWEKVPDGKGGFKLKSHEVSSVRSITDHIAHLGMTHRLQFATFTLWPVEVSNRNVFSRWPGFAARVIPDPDPEAIKWFMDHMQVAIAAGCGYKRDYVVSWLASVIRNPGTSLCMCIIAYGTSGIGKSIIFQEVVGRMLGVGISLVVTGSKVLVADFQSELTGKVFLGCEEVKESENNIPMFNAIKEAITSSNMQRKKKFEDNITVRNALNISICSNQHNPMPMLDGMPRKFTHCRAPTLAQVMSGGDPTAHCPCGKCPPESTLSWEPPYTNIAEKKEHFARVGGLLGTDQPMPGLDDCADVPPTHWVNSIFTFMLRDYKPILTNFQAESDIPQSDARSEALYDGRNSAEQYVYYLHAINHDDLHKWILFSMLYDGYRFWHNREYEGSKKQMLGSKNFARVLNELGVEQRHSKTYERRLSSAQLDPETLRGAKLCADQNAY